MADVPKPGEMRLCPVCHGISGQGVCLWCLDRGVVSEPGLRGISPAPELLVSDVLHDRLEAELLKPMPPASLVDDVWAQIRQAHLHGVPTRDHRVAVTSETLNDLRRDLLGPVDHGMVEGSTMMFGLPVVVNDSVPPGTALLVDGRRMWPDHWFRSMALWDRLVCANCDGLRDESGVDPSRCRACADSRFWWVVAGLMVALVVLAVVAKLIGGA